MCQKDSISNHQFCAGRFDELSPLFAKRFAAQTLVYSKTCRCFSAHVPGVFGIRRWRARGVGDSRITPAETFDLFNSNEFASTCHPCREEMLSVDALQFLTLPFAASRIS